MDACRGGGRGWRVGAALPGKNVYISVFWGLFFYFFSMWGAFCPNGEPFSVCLYPTKISAGAHEHRYGIAAH